MLIAMGVEGKYLACLNCSIDFDALLHSFSFAPHLSFRGGSGIVDR